MKEHPDYKYRPRRKAKPLGAVNSGHSGLHHHPHHHQSSAGNPLAGGKKDGGCPPSGKYPFPLPLPLIPPAAFDPCSITAMAAARSLFPFQHLHHASGLIPPQPPVRQDPFSLWTFKKPPVYCLRSCRRRFPPETSSIPLLH